VDREVIRQKLDSLRRCVARVNAKCPVDTQALASDVDAQDIVTLNLSRAIQICVDVGAHLISASGDKPAPSTMGQTFQRLAQDGVLEPDLAARLRRAVGFRNIVVHNYEVMDWQVVHALARDHLDDFNAFASAVVDYLQWRGASL
jgi:uncharacterized protein YutE (UPF0331/DUF86 family)